MKSIVFTFLATLAIKSVEAHATFQQLWVDGHGAQCVRLPPSNSPVVNVASNDIACNVGGTRGQGGKCPVRAGGIVTVEMHQQNGDRNCANEAIGGAHYGPVMIYISKVTDASTADGTSGTWHKIHEIGWAKSPSGQSGDDDFWGVKDLNKCCGRMDVRIPADLESGDYLLRAEVIALHTAGSSGGAQFYMSCFQVSVSGGSGSLKLGTGGVKFPGAYAASNPGILVQIHTPMSSYTVPGPNVISAGRRITAGQGCAAGCEVTCKPGTGPTGTAVAPPAPTGGGGSTPGGCAVAQWGQCGGQGYTGCTTCASPYVCRAVSPPHYSQCQV
ncbi:glycosyl hydrolase family 61-domain-containing protein [Plectosphaerella cucumerina]|uniref:lytic cellulose monooxygenase (C4-dehydrogenating) n=1 Tax=Plectosphaerella cucumerina TaxID=40658 RepID=A0A8K0TUX6_9PEZI|nr:glycosyl hydrolase family 61-domain-containing protein [Plectosphaerella cucumerina]